MAEDVTVLGADGRVWSIGGATRQAYRPLVEDMAFTDDGTEVYHRAPPGCEYLSVQLVETTTWERMDVSRRQDQRVWGVDYLNLVGVERTYHPAGSRVNREVVPPSMAEQLERVFAEEIASLRPGEPEPPVVAVARRTHCWDLSDPEPMDQAGDVGGRVL